MDSNLTPQIRPDRFLKPVRSLGQNIYLKYYMSIIPLTANELEEALENRLEDPAFDMPFMLGSLAKPAQQLAHFHRTQQNFILACATRVAAIHEQIAYQFVLHAAQALKRLGEEGIDKWLVHIMDIYDVSGIFPAIKAIKGLEDYERFTRIQSYGVLFSEVERILNSFVNGLSGRQLICTSHDEMYTDTETLYLPDAIGKFDNKKDNFRLYKAMVGHLWAQTWYGSFPLELPEYLMRFEKTEKALCCFQALETLRLDACLSRDLPGLHREMQALQEKITKNLRGFQNLGGLTPTSHWQHCAVQLAHPDCSVFDSLALIEKVYASPLPQAFCYQSRFFPDRVEEIRQQRLKREKHDLTHSLIEMAKDITAKRKHQLQRTAIKRLKFRAEVDERQHRVQLFINEQPVFSPPEMQKTLNSIAQDLGHIPPEWLEAAGEGVYENQRQSEAEENHAETTNISFYDEWNYRRRSYHKNWCTLKEVPITPQDDGFIQQTLQKYRPLIQHLRRSFEIFRSGDKRLKRQLDGDEVDIDALIETLADAASGLEMSQHVFTRLHKVERDVVVIFLVDMSGSTKGWINQAERESLILLCEAVETLGDRYGIYGFSGMTRTRCEIYPIKTLEETYDDTVRERICAIKAKDYTRMGAAIRYTNKLLSEIEAKTRLLVTLSDGKPDDFDNYYRGQYGIEDTRQALIESKRQGIHPFCITLDKEGPDYLPRLYGPVNYTVVDQVHKLPLKVADIYRVLTTR